MRFGIIALILVNGLVYGQKKEGTTFADVPLFSIKGKPVTTGEFIYLYKKNHLQPQDFTEEKINEYLNLFINFKLKIAEAKSRGLDTTQAFVKEFNTYKEELKKPYRAGTDDLDRLTKEAYDRSTEEVKVAHLLIMVKPDAAPSDTLAAFNKIKDLQQRALAGQDFEKLAKEYSEDPSAKMNNGNLGYFTALQMVYPFEDAAYKTKVGGISSIVRTRFGYHIIQILDRRPARGEVEVSHILLRKGKDNDTKIKNTIFEIYDQLKGGRKWEDLCREFSEDTNTKDSGGRLRPFAMGALSSVPEFEQVSFSLNEPGAISDPFQSAIGWHIIRLEKRIPVPSYKETEASLKRRVARDERLTISKASSLEKRKRELGFTEENNVKTRVLSLADSTLTKGKWHYAGEEALRNQVLFTMQAEKTTVGDFVRWVSANETTSTLSPSAYMKQLYERFTEERINEKEELKIMSENPDYKMLLNEYKEGILLFEIMEKEVWNKASEDSTGQRKYYGGHPDKFKAGNRVEARIFATPDKTFREETKNKMASGDTLKEADLKKFKSVTHWKKYEAKESQIIDQINWVPGLHDAEVNNTYYLVEVSRLVPPGNLTFDEARAKVISEYQDALEKEWLIKLRQNYPVNVNKKGKQIVITELKK
jgi:peptidyl-prolyl cis-trans isomerase SurA